MATAADVHVRFVVTGDGGLRVVHAPSGLKLDLSRLYAGDGLLTSDGREIDGFAIESITVEHAVANYSGRFPRITITGCDYKRPGAVLPIEGTFKRTGGDGPIRDGARIRLDCGAALKPGFFTVDGEEPPYRMGGWGTRLIRVSHDVQHLHKRRTLHLTVEGMFFENPPEGREWVVCGEVELDPPIVDMGPMADEATASRIATANMAATAPPMVSRNEAPPTVDYLTGVVADVERFDRPLSDEEIRERHASPWREEVDKALRRLGCDQPGEINDIEACIILNCGLSHDEIRALQETITARSSAVPRTEMFGYQQPAPEPPTYVPVSDVDAIEALSQTRRCSSLQDGLAAIRKLGFEIVRKT